MTAERAPLIVSIMGGLGNQLFQYSLGTYLTQNLGRKVRYDHSAIDHYNNRSVALEAIGLPVEWATTTETRNALGRFCSNMPVRRFAASRFGRLVRPANLITDHVGLTDSVEEKIRSNAALLFHGYWQTADLVEAVSPSLWDSFEFPGFGDTGARIYKKIMETNAVSIHVRRGDYASNPKAERRHGALNIDYYQRAIEHILQVTTNPFFYVFSDDPEYARANIFGLLPENAEMVSIENANVWTDLALMRACRHNIIANSTYSWWGAWLNKNRDKQIICPTPWFADLSPHNALIPQNWIQIPR